MNCVCPKFHNRAGQGGGVERGSQPSRGESRKARKWLLMLRPREEKVGQLGKRWRKVSQAEEGGSVEKSRRQAGRYWTVAEAFQGSPYPSMMGNVSCLHHPPMSLHIGMLHIDLKTWHNQSHLVPVLSSHLLQISSENQQSNCKSDGGPTSFTVRVKIPPWKLSVKLFKPSSTMTLSLFLWRRHCMLPEHSQYQPAMGVVGVRLSREQDEEEAQPSAGMWVQAGSGRPVWSGVAGAGGGGMSPGRSWRRGDRRVQRQRQP